MKKFLLLFSASIFFILLSCNSYQPGNTKEQSEIVLADLTAVQKETPPNIKERKFLRSASLKFKVNHADDAIIKVENKTRALGGYVSLSQLKNIVLDSNSIPISADSLMQTIHYSTLASLVVRVPDYQLDSLLAQLGSLSTMIFSREVHCDDVSTQFMAGQLLSSRSETANRRLKDDITRHGKKLSEIGEMEKTIDEKQAENDDAKISFLNLDDAVKFSTVSIEISQDQFIQYNKLVSEKFIPAYETPYLTLLKESLSGGWQMLKDITIFIAKCWSILLILGLICLTYFRYFRYIRVQTLK